MTKTQVGVLRGGPSREYDVSLATGQTVLEHLPRDSYEPRDIYIDKSGRWHMRGLPVDPARALSQVDVVWNGLHGKYGEDGQVQRLLDTHSKPYTGSEALASALCMHKVLTKEQAQGTGVRVAYHQTLERKNVTDRTAFDLFRSFPMPAILKPVRGGSSVGIYLVHTYPELIDALEQVFADEEEILMEQYIRGREVTVGVIDGFRNTPVYALPPIEIVPTKSRFFDYAEKYDGHAQEICPARFGPNTNRVLEDLAVAIHKRLGLRHYSRTDFILTPHGVYLLEVNTLPFIATNSPFNVALQAVGSDLPEFIGHVLGLAH